MQRPFPFQLRIAVLLFTNDIKNDTPDMSISAVGTILLCFEICALLSPMIAYIWSLREV